MIHSCLESLCPPRMLFIVSYYYRYSVKFILKVWSYQPCSVSKCQVLRQALCLSCEIAYLYFAILKKQSPVMAILTTGYEELLHIHAGEQRFHPLGGYSCDFHCLLEVHLQPLFLIICLGNAPGALE